MSHIAPLPFNPFPMAWTQYEEFWNAEHVFVFEMFKTAALKDRNQIVHDVDTLVVRKGRCVRRYPRGQAYPHYLVVQQTFDFHPCSSAKYPSFHTTVAVTIYPLGVACLSLRSGAPEWISALLLDSVCATAFLGQGSRTKEGHLVKPSTRCSKTQQNVVKPSKECFS